MTRYKRSTRRTLKQHLDSQWMRNYGGPYKERYAKASKLASQDAGKKWREFYQPEAGGVSVADILAAKLWQ